MNREIDHPLHARWVEMKNRCNRPERKDYPRYGGRGIAVCERWMSFANFVADVGELPFPGAQLERIDNDQGYSPGNVKWASCAEQSRNTSLNVWVEIDGVRLTWKEWAARLGVSHQALSYRAKVLGDRAAAIRSIETMPLHHANRVNSDAH